MPKIFISYRRADSEFIVGRIYDRLEAQFGSSNVFKDVENIPPGQDFRDVIRKAVRWCDVMLVIIGTDWLDAATPSGERRLVQPDDYVRFEIETAMTLEKLVVPILVKNADHPRANDLPGSIEGLAFFNSLPVRGDPDFNRDVRVLTRFLQDFDQSPAATMDSTNPGFNRRELDVSGEMEKPQAPPPRATPSAPTEAASPTPSPAAPPQASGFSSRVEVGSGLGGSQVSSSAKFSFSANRRAVLGLGGVGALLVLVLILALAGVFSGGGDDNDNSSDGDSSGFNFDNTGNGDNTPIPSPGNTGNGDNTPIPSPTGNTGGVARLLFNGLTMQTEYPSGWDADTDDFAMYIGNSSTLLNQMMTVSVNSMGEYFATDFSSGSGLVITNYAGLYDGAFTAASNIQLVLAQEGIAFDMQQVSAGGYSGWRTVVGTSSDTRYIDIYDVDFGVQLVVFIISDEYSTRQTTISQIIGSTMVQ